MRKVSFCTVDDCGRWKDQTTSWQDQSAFTSKDQERLSWRRVPCDKHEEVVMVGTVGEEYYDEDGVNDDVRPPIVVYCLHLFEDNERCKMTTWHGMDHWGVNLDRLEGMNSGRYTSIMGPYCENHKAEKQLKKGA